MQSPVVSEHTGISDTQIIQTCVAIGYPVYSFAANSVVSHRAPVTEVAQFIGFDEDIARESGSHFRLIFVAVIETFQDILGSAWSPEFQSSWSEVLAKVDTIIAEAVAVQARGVTHVR
jgi:hypothetical protein